MSDQIRLLYERTFLMLLKIWLNADNHYLKLCQLSCRKSPWKKSSCFPRMSPLRARKLPPSPSCYFRSLRRLPYQICLQKRSSFWRKRQAPTLHRWTLRPSQPLRRGPRKLTQSLMSQKSNCPRRPRRTRRRSRNKLWPRLSRRLLELPKWLTPGLLSCLQMTHQQEISCVNLSQVRKQLSPERSPSQTPQSFLNLP
ncbi:uncharacterized protein B0I36DRAFT_317531 [Microdochium trichocladiopsis]|uniref:Uncharacterized protein n=1 Tax=Microdochium trichocladiopsis TaxID=1682393 RepID=A0A9P8YDS5_9PEZI|nr:uncharacterized protein B0I36DRAFT_317531 [Microdochium trichocladiopsis]KAH7035067.1 hypothetical protein B0I36DRAFT_317531 [Microdochium trichocladiopsis]